MPNKFGPIFLKQTWYVRKKAQDQQIWSIILENSVGILQPMRSECIVCLCGIWRSSNGLTLLRMNLSRNSIYTDRRIPLPWSFLRYYVHIRLFCKTYVTRPQYVQMQYMEQKKEGAPRTKKNWDNKEWVFCFLAQEVMLERPPQERIIFVPCWQPPNNTTIWMSLMDDIIGWHLWTALY